MAEPQDNQRAGSGILVDHLGRSKTGAAIDHATKALLAETPGRMFAIAVSGLAVYDSGEDNATRIASINTLVTEHVPFLPELVLPPQIEAPEGFEENSALFHRAVLLRAVAEKARERAAARDEGADELAANAYKSVAALADQAAGELAAKLPEMVKLLAPEQSGGLVM